jgi:hypothetical protein
MDRRKMKKYILAQALVDYRNIFEAQDLIGQDYNIAMSLDLPVKYEEISDAVRKRFRLVLKDLIENALEKLD